MALDKHIIGVMNGSSNARQDREILGKLFSYVNTSGPGSISSVNILSLGSFATLPTVALTGAGSGGVLQSYFQLITSSIATGGTGYAVGNNIVLAGGTGTAAIQITVTSIGAAGVITGYSISNTGLYTVLPTTPATQASTTGSGTGATFNLLTWSFANINVTSAGTGYNNTSAVSITGGGSTGGAVAALVINSTNQPLTIPITAFKALPNIYGVFVNMGQVGDWYVPQNSKTNTTFNIVLTPPTGGSIAAGSIDILVSA